MQQLKPYILPAIVLLLFGVSYYPAFDGLVSKWSASDDYTHAFFTVPVVAYMIWLQRSLLVESCGRPLIGIVLIVLSVLLYLVSLQLQIPTITSVATVFTVISGLIYFGGFRVLKEMAIPILLLFMVIPVPNQLLSMITASLQLKVSQASETIVQLFSVPLFREGNILQIPGKTFQVVDACSGIRSLISMTTLSLIIGYFTLTRGRSILFLLLFSIPVAVVINIVRVISLVLVYYYFKIDITSGTWHTVSGLLLFSLGLVMLFSFQRILEYWEGKKQYS